MPVYVFSAMDPEPTHHYSREGWKEGGREEGVYILITVTKTTGVRN